jgi:hypothetical protein
MFLLIASPNSEHLTSVALHQVGKVIGDSFLSNRAFHAVDDQVGDLVQSR